MYLLPVVLVFVGAALLLATTNAVEGDAWSVVWPFALIALGLTIVFGRSLVRADAARGDDVVTAAAFFSSPSLRSTSRGFRRASLTAVFGKTSLDLRAAQLHPDGATVTATALFGGVLVPRGWRVTTRTTPILGGVADKTDPQADPPLDAPTVIVDGLALFGDVEVKHEK